MRGAHRMGPALPAAVLAATVGLLAGIPASAASLLTITPRTTIAPGQQQTVTFTVPAELLTHKLALSLLARLDAPQMSGSTGALQLVLNGRPLQIERLLNKATDTEMLSGLKLDWFVTGAWRIVYSPDYEAANRDNDQNCLVGGHAYDFVLSSVRLSISIKSLRPIAACCVVSLMLAGPSSGVNKRHPDRLPL